MDLRADHALAAAMAAMFQAESPVSHYDLDQAFPQFGLVEADPKTTFPDQQHGKAKRVKAVLTYAAESAPEAGGRLVAFLIQRLRGHGAFREGSDCCMEAATVANAREALRSAGFALASDGSLAPLMLDALTGRDLTEALQIYVDRARRGASDAALVAGTGKDLVEATARHVLVERQGGYQPQMNLPGTLYQAFDAVGLTAPSNNAMEKINASLAEDHVRRVHECLYVLGVAVNRLRNDQGIGHGRPFPATVNEDEARLATETMGLLAGLLLSRL